MIEFRRDRRKAVFLFVGILSRCPLLALSGHELVRCTCLLSGVKRTWLFATQMSAYDPKADILLAPDGQLLLDVGHHWVRQARVAEFRKVFSNDLLP